MPRKAGPGRPKGSKNRRTEERDTSARLAAERQKEIERLEKMGGREEFLEAMTSGFHLAKDVLEHFMKICAAKAMYYAPAIPGYPANQNANDVEFKENLGLAVDIAKALVPYQSPRLSAVMVGTAIVNKIEVSGGLPDDHDGGLMESPKIIDLVAKKEGEAA